MVNRGPIGVYPGSFHPPTVAHLAVAEAALAAAGLVRVDLTFSRDALGKDPVGDGHLDRRIAHLRGLLGTRPDLGVAVSEHRLIADLARGHDAVVIGADKWRQMQEPDWYGGIEARDRALARLPLVLIAPRADDSLSDLRKRTAPHGPEVRILDLPDRFRKVSSTAVRQGADRWRLRPDDVAGVPTGRGPVR